MVTRPPRGESVETATRWRVVWSLQFILRWVQIWTDVTGQIRAGRLPKTGESFFASGLQ